MSTPTDGADAPGVQFTSATPSEWPFAAASAAETLAGDIGWLASVDTPLRLHMRGLYRAVAMAHDGAFETVCLRKGQPARGDVLWVAEAMRRGLRGMRLVASEAIGALVVEVASHGAPTSTPSQAARITCVTFLSWSVRRTWRLRTHRPPQATGTPLLHVDVCERVQESTDRRVRVWSPPRGCPPESPHKGCSSWRPASWRWIWRW